MEDNNLDRIIKEEEEYELEDADYLQEQEFADEYEDRLHESTAASVRERAPEDEEEKELIAAAKKTRKVKKPKKRQARKAKKKKKR